MNPISKGLHWKYQKNEYLIESLIFRNAPKFLYQSHPDPLKGEIPVFTFHTALPEWFEEQCVHLVENGYRTLSADEFLSALSSPGRCIEKSVLLTFDDGLKHVWTIAYPLLKKYNLKATCFLIPGCIPEDDHRIRPTLEDYWQGRASLQEVLILGRGSSSLATWAEIKTMHESGIVDFQSHTMYHSLVFTSDNIFDFVHPGYNTHFYGNIHIPLYSNDNEDVVSRDAVMGMPIYFAKPRMLASNRFFDDERIRKRCIELVQERGSKYFFKDRKWRSVLHKAVADCRKTITVKERYETPEERNKVVFEELLTSKRIIEEKLRGKKVTHLCYPWYKAEEFAIQASRKAGFKANYFGQLKGRPTNRPGDDPYRVVRVEDIFLKRLPGRGREAIRDIFKRRYEFRNVPELLGFSQQR